MGDWFSNVANWASEQASRAATAAGNTANWIGDGVTHPGDALNTAWQQINNAPAYYDALNHGFSSVEAYQAYLAKQPQGSVPNNPVNNAINSVVNAIPGAAPVLALGGNYGTSFGPGSADGSGLNLGINPTPRPNNGTVAGDAQINAAADAYKNQAGPPSVHMFSFGQIDPGTGLQYSGDTTGWVSQAQFAQMNNVPAPTTPQSVAEQQIAAGNARPGDHRINPQTGVSQTFGIDGVWRDGNSASPPNAVSLPTNPAPSTTIGQVSTTSQNPMTTASQWDDKYAIQHQQYVSAGLSDEADINARILKNLGPKPGAPGTPGGGPALVTPEAQNPVGVGQPGGPSGPPAPGTTGTNPAGTADGAGGIGGAVAWIIKNLGLDANTAAILASGGASSVASWMAADEQAKGATNAATTQSLAYADALKQQKEQFGATNKINKDNYDAQQQTLEPWLKSGTDALDSFNTTLGGYDPNKALSGDPSTWQDPGYQFRLDEGIKALQNSAAAKGGLLSGNTMRGITDYAQGSASQEYKNAYDRYNTTFGNRVNALNSLAGMGQTAVGQSINAGNNYASNSQQAAQNNSSAYANLTTGQGNALAQGILGASNAKASGYAAGNTIAQGMLSQYTQLQQANAQNDLAKAIYAGKK